MPSTARSAAFGRGIAWLIDVVLWWPLSMIFAGLSWVFRMLRQLLGLVIPAFSGTQPVLSKTQRERWGVVLRCLLILPLLLFVLFPFYWIIITAFKTDLPDPAVSPRSTGPTRGRSTSSVRC